MTPIINSVYLDHFFFLDQYELCAKFRLADPLQQTVAEVAQFQLAFAEWIDLRNFEFEVHARGASAEDVIDQLVSLFNRVEDRARQFQFRPMWFMIDYRPIVVFSGFMSSMTDRLMLVFKREQESDDVSISIDQKDDIWIRSPFVESTIWTLPEALACAQQTDDRDFVDFIVMQVRG